MTQEVYTPPQSDLTEGMPQEVELASRGKRLGASLIDGLIISLVTIPLMYFTGGFEGLSEGVKPSFAYSIAMGLVGLVAFLLINFKTLVSNGQTIGKKLLSIKITTMEGQVPDLKKNLVPRYAVYFLPGQVPAVGQLFSIVNILFIFGKERRCIHDLAAGTHVVEGD
jgi:uncharacterized RDD family membrane protein YckC